MSDVARETDAGAPSRADSGDRDGSGEAAGDATSGAADGVAHRAPADRPAGLTDAERMAAHVRRVRADNALGRLTVVVDSIAAGQHLLRVLGTGAPIFNVEPITLPTLVGRFSDLAPARDDEVVRAAARVCESIEDFGAVRSEVSTIEAVARIFRELSWFFLDEWPAPASGVSHAVVQACRAMAAELAGRLACDTVAAAARRLSQPEARSSLGTILTLAETVERGSAARYRPVLDALADATEIVERDSGQSAADQIADARAREVIAAAHPVAEVHVVVQRLLAVGPGRGGIGIAVSDPSVYLRELAHRLDEAGVAWHDPTGRSLLETRTARTVVAMLAVTPGLRRNEISAVVEPGLIDVDGYRLRFAAFENLTRRTGFDDSGQTTRLSAAVAGGDDWQRLAAIADSERDTEPWRAEQRDATVALVGVCESVAAAALQSFHSLGAAILDAMNVIAVDVQPDESAARAVIRDLARSWQDSGMPLPPSPRGASEMVTRALNVGAPVNGTGRARVAVGTISQMRSLDLDHLFILGAGEGSCPSIPAEDPLLPDIERAGVPGLPTVTDRIAAQGDDWLAALRSARSVTISYARDSLRSNVEQFPSRYLDGVAAASPARVTHVDGTVRLLREATTGQGTAVSERDYRLAAGLTAGTMSGVVQTGSRVQDSRVHDVGADSDVWAPSLDIVLARDCRQSRDAGLFNEWNGYVRAAGDKYVARHAGHRAVAADEFSATALESYLTCPHGYLVQNLVGASNLDRPEAADEVKSTDRGSLVHRIFELVTAEWTAGRIGDVAQLRARAQVHTDESIARFEGDAIVGDPFAWRIVKERIYSAVSQWCDDVAPMLGGSEVAAGAPGPISGERAFGSKAGRPTNYVVTESNRTIRLQGSIDRIDVYDGPDGRAARIVDYKVANPKAYQSFRDPVRRNTVADLTAGRKLIQPGIYLAAVRDDDDITAQGPQSWTIGYHVFDVHGDLSKAEMTVTPQATKGFDDLMNDLDAGFAAGFFAPIGLGDRPHDYCSACHVGAFDTAQDTADGLGQAWLDLRDAPGHVDFRANQEGGAQA